MRRKVLLDLFLAIIAILAILIDLFSPTGGLLLAIIFFLRHIAHTIEVKKELDSPYLEDKTLQGEDIRKASMEAHFGPFIVETFHIWENFSNTGHVHATPFFFYLCLVVSAHVAAHFRDLYFGVWRGAEALSIRQNALVDKMRDEGFSQEEIIHTILMSYSKSK